MNVVLMIVDSLRARSLDLQLAARPRTPFLDRLREQSLCFQRAYATECWTLPAHASMFTGLLPSEHGAHFQSMAYRGSAPTIAQILREEGRRTLALSRCPIFEGSIPGITRGFEKVVKPLAPSGRFGPAGLLVALTKPRLRRQLRETGFFHPDQAANVEFIARYVRALLPADARLLEHAIDCLRDWQTRGEGGFLFCNLFDVHAPYCPSPDSLWSPVRNSQDLLENLQALDALARIGSHRYLREGFRMPERGRSLLLARYHRAIELEDEKLRAFYEEATSRGLLDDTLLIIAGDHGEAFGEQGLYCHDGSLSETHLRVPLWIHHPRLGSGEIEDVVSMRSLFTLILRAALEGCFANTLVDPSHRERHPIAIAEHFYYPHLGDMLPAYRRNQVVAIEADRKLLVRGREAELYEGIGSYAEDRPIAVEIEALAYAEVGCGSARAGARRDAAARLQRFQDRFGEIQR